MKTIIMTAFGLTIGIAIGMGISNAYSHTPCDFEPECKYILVPNPYSGQMEVTLVCND
jgi:hypothetical protein